VLTPLALLEQEHLGAGATEVRLIGSEEGSDGSSDAARAACTAAAAAARWALAGPPSLAAAQRHGPALALRCLDLTCGGGPEPLVEPAARALFGLLSARHSGVAAAARHACQQHLPGLLRARLPPSAYVPEPAGGSSGGSGSEATAVTPAEAVVLCLCREGVPPPSLGTITALAWSLWRCAGGNEASSALLAFAR
jgi:hypothetical protein